jgi:hypothetical protein
VPVQLQGLLNRFSTYLVLILITVLIAACSEENLSTTPVNAQAYAVDPQFREFYNKLGGASVLGEAISPVQYDGDAQEQYTMASLLVFDPQKPLTRFHLAPIGLDLGIGEPPVAKGSKPGEYYVGGHYVYKNFVNFYVQLGAENYVGKPLTEVRFNQEKRRYEQYFENLGFYQLEGEPSDSVHLLAYGAWKCGSRCSGNPPANALISQEPVVKPPFSDGVRKLGTDFTGAPLSEAYQAADGKLEQIFENVVLMYDTSDSSGVRLRPVEGMLGARPDTLEVDNKNPAFTFYPVQGDNGYNIPNFLTDYINQHGGLDVSGPPISTYSQLNDQLHHQCFLNLCLNVDQNHTIQPAPLGYTYRDQFRKAASQSNLAAPGGDKEVTLQVWNSYPMVSSTQEQEIGVSIQENNAPQANIEPVLVVTLPDGTQQPHKMPPTNQDGQSHFRVGPISAPNGTLIPYQVCISIRSGERYCYKDSYLIWNSQ